MAKINLNMDSLKPRREWKRHKVEEGTSTYRILPPFGEESNGYPYRKWNVIWGLLDPTTNKLKPFASPITYENKCPVYEYLDILKKKVDNDKQVLVSKLKSQGLTDEKAIEEQVKKHFESVNKFIGAVRPKTVYAYNASDKSGAVGILEIKSTAHKKLLALLHQYVQDYGQDPTSLNSTPDDSGLWFNFVRSGKGLATEYDVQKSQIKQNFNGQIAFVDDRSALHENIVKNYEDLAYDIHSIYVKKTYDEMRQIFLLNLKRFVEGDPQAGIAPNPYLAVPGFDDFSGLTAPTAAAASNQGAQQASSGQAQNVQKGSKPITTNFGPVDDGGDDEEDEAVVASQPAAQASKPAASAAPQSNDDIMAMADSLLNELN